MFDFGDRKLGYTNYPLPPVEPDLTKWPIYHLTNDDEEQFIQEVKADSLGLIASQFNKGDKLYQALSSVLYQERIRLSQTPWKADPDDEKDFWSEVKSEILKAQTEKTFKQEHFKSENDTVLRKIINRYVHEIQGNFDPKVFRIIQKIIPFAFSRFLGSRSGHSKKSFFSKKDAFHDRFKLLGDIEILRELSKKGTLIFVPTHFSNLDSPVIGWAVESCGLPAVIYGAGLNLFGSKILSFFMGNLGAYKLDRRKKNSIYLDVLKTYSRIAIQHGTHSLFFPGGTRSRSGGIETKLKLGLLSTAIEAQQHNAATGGKKIFVVPVTLNYHFILEASSLINQHLKSTGKEKYVVNNFEYSTTYTFLKLIYQFLSSSTDLTVSFGAPMDVVGNNVNANGESISHTKQVVQIEDYFKLFGEIKNDTQRNFEYTKNLGDKIVESYFKYNVVLSSHLLPFIGFKLLERKHPHLDLYGLLRLPKEDTQIPAAQFIEAIEKARTTLVQLLKEDKVRLSEELFLPIEKLIKHGLQNGNLFNAKSSLFRDSNGNFNTEDMKLLYFYHNRLEGYSLENYF